MVEQSLAALEAWLEDVRVRLERIEGRLAPRAALLSLEDAATALGVGATMMKRMVASGAVLTVALGRRRMVPASEVERLATPAPRPSRGPRPRSSKANQDPRALDALLRGRR